jgi:Kyakuja-Dileera-Zisupton transposase
MNIDYLVIKATTGKYTKKIKMSNIVYNIFCQWIKHFLERVEALPYLSIPEGMTISGGIGDFHVKGHVTECFTQHSLLFIEGTGVIDGEILEMLWLVLNETSCSVKGLTLAHWNEILDDHMNHSNWKKLIGIGKFISVPIYVCPHISQCHHLFGS